MKFLKKLLPSLLLASVLLLVAFGTVAAIPSAAPVRVITVNTASIAADTNFRTLEWAGYTYADVFYRIDVGVVNTNTLKLEVSPDGLNWYAHNDNGTVNAATAVDDNAYNDSIPVEGYKFRLVADLTNTQTVTPNIKVVLR